jgi:peptidoglycan/xylan/chitin deacetylase (PgdA/CDA1 family)
MPINSVTVAVHKSRLIAHPNQASDPMHPDDLIPDAVRTRDLVGYGPTPPPFRWPSDAKVVINLVLVYEEGSEYSVLWGDDRNDGWGAYADVGVNPPHRDPGTEGHYEYGSRAGVWRLARIYDEAKVPVTISGSAVALELNPAVADWMKEREHDLLGHGWRWIETWHQTRDEEREYLKRAMDSYERTLGYHPAGWNCRSWPSENTRELLVEEGGFIYDSDVAADDIPYYARCQDKPWLVVPYSKTYNDSRFLMSPGFASPRDYLETLTMGLQQLVSEPGISMMTVAVHPRWSGQAARAAVMKEFIAIAQANPDVAFMRREDIARWWLEQYPAKG